MWQNQDNTLGIARPLLLGAEVCMNEPWKCSQKIRKGISEELWVELDLCACISVEVQTVPDRGWCGPNGKTTFLFRTEK